MPTNPTTPDISSPISRLDLAISSARSDGSVPLSYAPVGSCFTFANDAEVSAWTNAAQCFCAVDSD